MTAPKGRAVPHVRTAAQKKALAKQALGAAQAEAAADAQTQAQAAAARVAQVANLIIAGFSPAQIGAQIGASAEEVERMLTEDTARYVRSQPSLRIWVRNWVSGKYLGLLDAVYDEATDKTHRDKLEHQDRALRILKEMSRLHGAEAPTQTEVKVEAAPAAVEALVTAISKAQGVGYDMDIFDVIEGEVVDEAVEAGALALERAEREVEQDQPGDEELNP